MTNPYLSPLADAEIESQLVAPQAQGDHGVSRSLLMGATIVLGSVGLFMVSLVPPAFHLDNGQAYHGTSLALIGWAGVLIGQTAWYANPLLILSWGFFMTRYTRWISLGLSFASLVIACGFFRHADMMANEAGHRSDIIAYDAGLYLWLASITWMLVASGVCAWHQIRRQRKRIRQDNATSIVEATV